MMTQVPANSGEWTDPPCQCRDGRWYGPPGYMILLKAKDGHQEFLIACPGCGELGGPRDGQRWEPTQGDWSDVTTLSLSPSILKNCCGWHGYLRDGVFVPC